MHNIERLITNKLIDYKDSIKMMEQRIQEIHQGTQNELIWFLNHNHIYTQGTSASNKEIIKNYNEGASSEKNGTLFIFKPDESIFKNFHFRLEYQYVSRSP